MSTINQLVSEIAHSVQQPNSVPVRRAIKLGIIHARNELIRKSYSNHNITDKGLQQRFKLALVPVRDGYDDVAIYGTKNTIKRTFSKVPRPTRLTNNLPFHSVRTAGVKHPVEIAFVKEASANFYSHLPGMACAPTYDYINGYIYINTYNTPSIDAINSIIVESVFEYPHIIPEVTGDNKEQITIEDDDNEFLLPEDMIGDIKKLVLETFNTQIVRETNEVPTPNII